MYAQTIVYGLFSARCLDKTPEDFSVEEAIDLIPSTNPFLRGLMKDCLGVCRGGFAFDELGIGDVVDMFAHVDAAVIANDFGRRTGGGREDPVIYFYEDFLKAYDKEQKVKCGEFYTPQPVVGFMVRAVDHILKTRFNLPDGLATDATKKVKYVPEGMKKAKEKDAPAIQILDPATGTGTFIREIILNIYETFKKKNPILNGEGFIEAWSRYVDRNVLPRLNAFELMMAPYAIAHMKLAMVLRDTGYDFKGDKRLQVYLTNSLEEPGNSNKQMMLFDDDPLAAESVAANAVKKNTGINIVIGNPPYSGISQNNGEWITKLVNEYKYTDGVYFGEKKHWLNDDYVKFIRLGQEYVSRSGCGVLAFITNHAFLDNPTFRAMRWNLLKAFDEIYVLDLHGSSKKKINSNVCDKDENVFDIQQGVSISIFIRHDSKKKATLGHVHHFDLFGSRTIKNDWLSKTSFEEVSWMSVAYSHPYYLFVPRNESGREQWEDFFCIKDFFSVHTTGIATARDGLVIDIDKDSLVEKIKEFCSIRLSDAQVREKFYGKKKTGKYLPGDTRGWSLSSARKEIVNNDHNSLIKQVAYRPYDIRYIYYSPAMVDWGREKVMGNVSGRINIVLMCCRQLADEDWYHVNSVVNVADICFISNKTKECGYYFPLYLYQEYHGKIQKVPNLNLKIVKKVEAAVGKTTPEDIFNYIYAVLHSPTYREKYKEFLKIDFPRIPYPTDAKMFHQLAALGAQLVAIHTMKDFDEAEDVDFDNAGGAEVVKVEYKDGAVYINKSSRFTNVERETFDQYIGGYQPLQKWLKDRKGRTLSADDISHYKRIVRALRRTAALMSEIDKLPVADE